MRIVTGASTRERALALIAGKPGISDTEIAEVLFGPGAPGAIVSPVCCLLADEGLTWRRPRSDGAVGNWLSKDGPSSG